MNKKIMAIGIIAMFLLTGFTAVSARTAKQSENVEKAGVSTTWTRFRTLVDFNNVENLEVTINGDPVDINSLSSDLTYKNVKITGTQKPTPDELVGSMAYSIASVFTINFVVNVLGNFFYWLPEDLLNRIVDSMLKSPGIYCFELGPFTVEMGKMDRFYYSGNDLTMRGQSIIKISQN